MLNPALCSILYLLSCYHNITLSQLSASKLRIQVHIDNDAALDLIEVEAFDTSRKNVSFGKPATQSSTFSNRVADNANDGDSDTWAYTDNGLDGELVVTRILSMLPLRVPHCRIKSHVLLPGFWLLNCLLIRSILGGGF